MKFLVKEGSTEPHDPPSESAADNTYEVYLLKTALIKTVGVNVKSNIQNCPWK